MSNQLGTGKRDNKGKLRYDLVNPFGHEGLVKVLTKGALKYEDHNWEKGMQWSKVIESLKRHLTAIEKGEDYDFDPNCEKCKAGECVIHTGELHADHLQCNAHFLSAYYRIYPQGDNRFSLRRPLPKIGLDIDEVLCNFIDPWIKLWNLKVPTAWFFDNKIMERFDKMRAENKLDGFYLNLPPLLRPEDIPFEPHCYVTSRPVCTEVTTKWLQEHGFPMRPVITVSTGESKVDVIKKAGIDIFVDDRFENFEELNRHGICCFLYDAPHNRRYNVGYKRIKSLKELKF